MTQQDKIKKRLKQVTNMFNMHEKAARCCYQNNDEAGIIRNERAMKIYQSEIDFLEELLEY